MLIGPIAEVDIPAVIALWQACGLTRAWNDPEKDLRFAMAGPASAVLVGKHDDAVIASVMVGHDGHRGALYYFAVKPDQQRGCLGREIHDAAIDWLRQRGVWKINLLVRAENTEVHGFYRSLGYVESTAIGFWKNIAR